MDTPSRLGSAHKARNGGTQGEPSRDGGCDILSFAVRVLLFYKLFILIYQAKSLLQVWIFIS